jgi:hypothetical protein
VAAPPVPGQNHPAVEHLSRSIRAYTDRDIVLAYVPQEAAVRAYEAVDVSPVYEPPPLLQFRRQRAAQSLYPEYGSYVWYVWTDQYGRFVTDDEAVWWENPQAIALPEWNPA